MRSGRLNQIVQLHRLQSTEDELGQEINSWVQYAEVWAGIEREGAREPFDEDQLNSRHTCRIVMRYRSDVALTDRITHTDREGNVQTYHVTGQPEQMFGGHYRGIEMTCERVVTC